MTRIERSVARLALYEKMDTDKIDVSQLTAQQTVDRILEMIQENA
jgi:ribosomal protein S12 methylthiotransferase accessory factor YcaO